MKESDLEFTSRLDRDSQYRIAALHAAATRATMREKLADDKVETTVYANYFFNWLKGDGDGGEDPIAENRERKL